MAKVGTRGLQKLDIPNASCSFGQVFWWVPDHWLRLFAKITCVSQLQDLVFTCEKVPGFVDLEFCLFHLSHPPQNPWRLTWNMSSRRFGSDFPFQMGWFVGSSRYIIFQAVPIEFLGKISGCCQTRGICTSLAPRNGTLKMLMNSTEKKVLDIWGFWNGKGVS